MNFSQFIKKNKSVSVFIGIVIVLVIVWFLSRGVIYPQHGSSLDTSLKSYPAVQQIKQESKDVGYDEIFRNNEKYLNQIVYFRGEVVQSVDNGNNNYLLRIATKKEIYGDGYFDDVILVSYSGQRLLEGDIVDVWGKSLGLESYDAVLGNKITIPSIQNLYLELVRKSGGETVNQPYATGNPSTPIASNTQEGVSLDLNNYKFENKGDNWGKITEVSFTLKNNAGKTIYPDLILEIYDQKDNQLDPPSKNIELTELVSDGESITKTIPLDFGVARTNLTKTIKLSVVDYSRVLVAVYLKNITLS